MLQKLKGFKYATVLDLNMGYYTIRLDPNAMRICTIILHWGKYFYQILPIDIAGPPDILQEEMFGLMVELKFVRMYLDDLLILTRDFFTEHLIKLKEVIERILKACLFIKTDKSTFGAENIE